MADGDQIELIYDQLIADEKLKHGTKYERLAAIVFKQLNSTEGVVHDVKLRGEGKETAHQIDVKIGRQNRQLRAIIECRHFDLGRRRPKIDLPAVRDFASVVRDLEPDQAVILTTVGFTEPAETYAREQGIQLAILRAAKDEDWEGRLREIRITGHLRAPGDPTVTTWLAADDAERERVRPLLEAQREIRQELINTEETFFLDAGGKPEASLTEVLDPIFQSIHRGLSPGRNQGTAALDRVRHIMLGDVLVAVKGFEWEIELYEWTQQWVNTIGGQIARLLIKTLDGEVDRLIFEKDIIAWEIASDGEVRPRRGDAP